MFAQAFFVFKNNFNPFASSIRFILSNGKHYIDFELTVRCGSIIILQNCFPITIMRFQDCLGIVIIPDVAKPTVQFGYQNKVNFILPDIIKKSLKILPVLKLFASSETFIYVIVYNFIIV